jgi:hypothetical protein
VGRCVLAIEPKPWFACYLDLASNLLKYVSTAEFLLFSLLSLSAPLFYLAGPSFSEGFFFMFSFSANLESWLLGASDFYDFILSAVGLGGGKPDLAFISTFASLSFLSIEG